jgi:hypothetical protein
VVAGFATSLEEDVAALRAQPPPPYRQQLALRYRLTRKRIAAQQAAWADALLPVVGLCAARVPAMLTAGATQAEALEDSVARYVQMVAALASAELRVTVGREEDGKLARKLAGGVSNTASTPSSTSRDRDAAVRGE